MQRLRCSMSFSACAEGVLGYKRLPTSKPTHFSALRCRISLGKFISALHILAHCAVRSHGSCLSRFNAFSAKRCIELLYVAHACSQMFARVRLSFALAPKGPRRHGESRTKMPLSMPASSPWEISDSNQHQLEKLTQFRNARHAHCWQR